MTKPIIDRPLKQRGRPPKGGQSSAEPLSPAPSTPPPEPSGDGPPPVSETSPAQLHASGASDVPLKDLAAEFLAARKGDPAKARTPKALAKGERATRPGARSVKAGEEKPVVDELAADQLAGVLGHGEAELASFFVPDDKADKVQKLGGGMLKTAWKYHFIKHGIDNFPSWVVLLLAHLGLLAAVLVPNKERVSGWWDKFAEKFTKKKPESKDQKSTGTAPPPKKAGA